MSIFYQNTRGLKTKTKSFYKNLLDSDHSVICITETWLHEHISSNELFDCRYFVIRNDRNFALSRKADGGGVLIALTKNDFKSFIQKPSWITPTVEMVGISSILIDNTKLHIICL
jgi:hypothetical protein